MNSDQPQRIPFNLERALAGDPVVRRDGVKVSEVLRFKGGNILKPVVSLAENGGFFLHNEDGEMFGDVADMRDLFMAPKTKTVWTNLYYLQFIKCLALGSEFGTEAEARAMAAKSKGIVKTVSVEVPA